MPSSNEDLEDSLIEHAYNLLRVGTAATAAHLARLEKVLGIIADTILTRTKKWPARPKARDARLQLLLKEVETAITKGYHGLSVLNSATLQRVAVTEATWTIRALNTSIRTDVAKAITENAAKAIAENATIDSVPFKDYWQKTAGDAKFRVQQTIRRGMEQQLHPRAIVEAINTEVAPQVTRHVETLVRTSINSVGAATREATFEKNNDLIKGYLWKSTLDNRVSLICASLDGLRWDADFEPIGHDKVFQRPPRHPNCRSVVSPILKTYREIGLDLDEVPEGTRRSMDGKVPASTTFKQFLDKKGSAFQDKLLGPTRAKLYREGKLSLGDLTDTTGRPLGLDELLDA